MVPGSVLIGALHLSHWLAINVAHTSNSGCDFFGKPYLGRNVNNIEVDYS